MKITYDGEVDAPDIRFSEATATTRHLAANIAVDNDAHRRLIGIELLDVVGNSDIFGRSSLRT